MSTVRALLPLLLAAVSPHSALTFSVGAPLSSATQKTSLTPLFSGSPVTATSGTTVDYGGIPYVAVLVGDRAKAVRYYHEVLGMVIDDAETGVVRAGGTRVRLLELPNPDPLAVDPTYDMSAPPPGYVARGRPVHAGRDRHVAITLHDLAPLKAALEKNDVPYTMSYSGRQALFCRDHDGNGWEFGPPVTYAKATRLFPPYLNPPTEDESQAPIRWGGLAHTGLLVRDTPASKVFYCDVLGMVDETDLRPEALPFPGLFLRCGEQQVHILELPNPDPNTVDARPGYGKDRRTAYSVKSLEPVQTALDRAGIAFKTETAESTNEKVLYCYDPDANELVFVEDGDIQVIKEDMINMAPMVPWTRLW